MTDPTTKPLKVKAIELPPRDSNSLPMGPLDPSVTSK